MSNSADGRTMLDFEQLKKVLPQRFPFIMLDRVVEVEPGVKVVGIKNLTGNEWFYQGHFPDQAITPGVLISEAIAQTGIVFCQLSQPAKKGTIYLLGSLKIRFLRPALPGDQLRIEVTPVKLTAQAAILNGRVTVDGTDVARGEFALMAKTASAI